MATEQLPLHSQGVHAYQFDEEANDYAFNGPLVSGDFDGLVVGASSARFALPSDFDSSGAIASATLNLHARSPTSGDHKHRIRVLASSSQVLPTTGTGVLAASGGSEEKTIGEGTFSPVLDYVLTGSFATYNVDIAAMLNQARTAGYLDGGYVVLLIQPVSYDTDEHFLSRGLGESNEPTIDLEYVAIGDTDPGGGGGIVVDPDLDGSGEAEHGGSGGIIGVPTLVGIGATGHYGSGGIDAIGSLDGIGQSVAGGSGEIDAGCVISGVGYAVHSGMSGIDAVGTIEGIGQTPIVLEEAEGIGHILGASSIEGIGYTDHYGAASITAVGSLVGVGGSVSGGSGSIAAVATLVGIGEMPEITYRRKRTLFAADLFPTDLFA
jgi:hypothetical protein